MRPRFPPFCALVAAWFLCVLAVSAQGAPQPSPSDPPREENYTRGRIVDWELVSLPTRPEAQQNLLVGRPQGEAKGAVLLFPGGNGANSFRRQGERTRLGNNFLVRSAPLFLREGFAAAIVDAPLDHASGMGDNFRTSGDHLTDIRAAVDHLAQEGFRDIFLIGTSRGTLSVAYLATRLTHPQVKGFVLTAGMDSIHSLPMEEAEAPVLVVHHANDGCKQTTYSGAQAIHTRLAKSARKHFISVMGGDTPISEPCEALSPHGFLGKEAEVVGAIAKWLRGEAAPAQAGP